MQFATWNVNSLAVRLPQVLDWLAANPVDVLALQLERKRAWVALYRAAGGGWERSASEPSSTP
jgi:exonuclease III